MKRFTMIAVVALLPLLTAACNTISGAGEDLSKGGQKLEKTAEQNKHY